MPSFYPNHLPPQLPYPTSDYHSQYAQVKYPGHQDAFTSYHRLRTNELGYLHPDPFDPYKNAAAAPPLPMYEAQNGHVHASLPHPVGAPMMPPLRMDDRYAPQPTRHSSRRHRHEPRHYEEQQPREEKATGGVSAKLDYEMEQMTDFVVEMTVGIIKPTASYRPTFRKWVLQVLNATRLPSATILLSLSYLSQRVRGLSAAGQFMPSERSLYQMLTVSLILGSKFLDDNTFQNKSWAEVSNITVTELNRDEREWLSAFQHRLHHDPRCADGYTTWEEKWNSYKAPAHPVSLHSLDTQIRRQRSGRNDSSPGHYHQPYPVSAMSSISLESESSNYATPTYSPFDPWFSQRSAVDRSPSTAPHTGPNTPDYYAAPAGWNRQYGYATVPHFTPTMDTYPGACEPSNYAYGGSNVWNCHGPACQCPSCRQTHIHRHGTLVVG